MADVLKDRAGSSSRWDKLVLSVLESRPTGATSLQKLGLTVLSVADRRTPESYHPHHYGGYDDDVAESLDGLRSEGYVELVGGKTYQLTRAGKKLVEEYLDDVESNQLKTISATLIPLMGRLTDDEIVSVVYSLFPELAEKSLIKHRVDTGPKRIKNVEVFEVAR